jgi:hypothetical protein
MTFKDWYYYIIMPFQDYVLLPGSFGLSIALATIIYYCKKLKW